MHNWSIGDRAIFISDILETDHAKLNNTIVTLALYVGYHLNQEANRAIKSAWKTDCGKFVAERCLHPIPDDKGSWKFIEKVTGWTPEKVHED